MAESDEQQYVLGTHDEELVRLGFQHRVWLKHASALWERAGFGPGQTILDLGCGPGYATLDLASLVGPSGKIIAVDQSERFLGFLEQQCKARGLTNVEIVRSDVLNIDLPLEGLDGAYARWVLWYLEKPQAVVSAIAKALKPGGSMAVMDYFNYGAFTHGPRSAALDRVVEAVKASVTAYGGDLEVMGRLPQMMLDCQLAVTEIRPILRIARPGSALWEWPGSFFENYLPILVEAEFLKEDEARAFEEDWRKRSEDPACFLMTPPMLEIIGTKV